VQARQLALSKLQKKHEALVLRGRGQEGERRSRVCGGWFRSWAGGSDGGWADGQAAEPAIGSAAGLFIDWHSDALLPQARRPTPRPTTS